MFRLLCDMEADKIKIKINGQKFNVPKGITVWTAMAINNEIITRLSPVAEQERSAYCAMGVCFECLVEINGLPNQQACLIKVENNMRIKCQNITQTTIQSEIVSP